MNKETTEKVLRYAEKVVNKSRLLVTPRCHRNQAAKVAGAWKVLELGEYTDAAGRGYQAIGNTLRATCRGRNK